LTTLDSVGSGLPPADSLRAALDAVFRSPAYNWSEEPRGPMLIREWWLRLQHWLEALQHGHPTLFMALVIALVLILAGVVVHGVVIMTLTVRGAAARGAGPAAPPPPRRGAAWYFREADTLAKRGRYAEAMQAAFTGMALELDARGVLRFDPSKTPGEYAREARLPAPDRDSLRALVSVLYAVVFGGASFGADDYRRWRAAAV
jgi:hypothetical protein